MITTKALLSLDKSAAGELLASLDYPWQLLACIKDFIISYGKTLSKDEYEEVSPCVWVHKGAEIAPTAFLGAACIIGAGSEVRHCAYIRGSALIGRSCVIGNSTEIKNAVLFDNVQVPHYNYVGDSILGYKAHMGAGSVTSNVKSDKTLITLKCAVANVETGLRKFGAVLGDGVEVGCNAVLNPGTVIGRNTVIYPLSSVRGVIPADSIFKSADNIVKRVINNG